MAAKFNQSPGGLGGERISALRKRIAELATPHVEKAVQTIVNALDAGRDTVRLQAATTLLELADTGGEGMDASAPGEGRQPAKILVIDRRQVSDAITERQSKESA